MSESGTGQLSTKAERLARRILYRIATGQLRPGDQLPALRIAQEQWGVSQSTVVRAYESLAASGYVDSRPRSGYYVRSNGTVDWLSRSRDDLHSLFEEVERRIRAETDMTVVGALRCLLELAEARAAREPECVFLECTRHQAEDLARQVRARLGVPCAPVSIGHPHATRRALPTSARVVLTTRFHEPEAQTYPGVDGHAIHAVEVGYAVEPSPGDSTPLPSIARVIAVDADQADSIAQDLAEAAGSAPAIAKWHGTAFGGKADELRKTVDATPDELFVLSPTVWESAPETVTGRDNVVPLRTVVADHEWSRIAGLIGVPAPRAPTASS